MNTSFFSKGNCVYLVEHNQALSIEMKERLGWLLEAAPIEVSKVAGRYVGPRKEMVTPWSTNAVEITQNAGISGITRIEQFEKVQDSGYVDFDPMLQEVYPELKADTLRIEHKPDPILHIEDIAEYNEMAGLALSEDEIAYLEIAASDQGRPFTDSEIFGFAQANSEHCRHKIFRGHYLIDGKDQKDSLFAMIRRTSDTHPNEIVSAYKDNCAFVRGFKCLEFSPDRADVPGWFRMNAINSVLALKAETHNFPTTVEPFMGAATGSGGEIRDRMGGGRGGIPLAGTACYMTSYPRLGDAPIGKAWPERDWLYQTPQQILTKASNGASDYGNKFGQPLIVGSLLTFEYQSKQVLYGYDKTIMLAGGIGYANAQYAVKQTPKKGDKLLMLGGDNYRIGMGGGAVSSVNTGAYAKKLELNAVQRSNPEMQKRLMNALRGILESTNNPIFTIHDHGAGGHMNSFSELLEETGGIVHIQELPVGDPTLSDKEIIGNESQERMGLIVNRDDLDLVRRICEREKSPVYVVGEVTGDGRVVFENGRGERPVDLGLHFLFGKPPKTVIDAKSVSDVFAPIACSASSFGNDFAGVLSLEGVGCKDWLTNKVDRSVTGRIALQQCVGPLQLPLSGAGVAAIDYTSNAGIATSMGHNPAVGLIDPAAGSVMSITEALTNLVFVPLRHGLQSVSLSANWMWPCKMPGEDARLYRAVRAASEFVMALGINIPTGKDSLSMTQKYDNGSVVRAPGTVIISTGAACDDLAGIVTPDLKPVAGTCIVYVNLSTLSSNPLGGSSFAQTKAAVGNKAPTVADPDLFAKGFELVQSWGCERTLLAGQDVSAGGVVTALVEMAFTGNCGLNVEWETDQSADEIASFLFCEKPGLLVQVMQERANDLVAKARSLSLEAFVIAKVNPAALDFTVHAGPFRYQEKVDALRKVWFKPSFLLEEKQTTPALARERFDTFDKHPLHFTFANGFSGKAADLGCCLTRKEKSGVKAAIIREKGTNGEREMAYSLYAAGFDVKDVMMTDLTSGRENLEDVQLIVFCGGFSNSDVLGSAKGWAGSFRYNARARKALERYYARKNTLSLGICNGCQLMVGLDLVYPDHEQKPCMQLNMSRKFESAFLAVDVQPNTNAILLQGLQGCRLGIWVAHGEGRFILPEPEERYDIAIKYVSSSYPANPNGSSYNAGGIVSHDGRHLAMMPHLERAVLPWQWAYYPLDRKAKDEVTPWIQAFVNAREWVKMHM